MQLISWSTLSQGRLVSQVTYFHFLHFKSPDLWKPNGALDEVCRPSRGNNGVQLEPRSPAPWRRCRPARPPRPSAAAMRAGEWRRH
jgi:hypothetical protein